MASTKYTGKFKKGEAVRYRYWTPAISCQSSYPITGRGVIAGTERANGTMMYVIDGCLLFEREVRAVSVRGGE